jgi:hypothetical protein
MWAGVGFAGMKRLLVSRFASGALLLAACAVLVALGAGTAIPNSTSLHTGDVVSFSGSVTRVSTIAVFLFITGPGKDARGVTLENLNVPAG